MIVHLVHFLKRRREEEMNEIDDALFGNRT